MRAKRSLGQNFLTSKAVVKMIVSAGEVKKTDVVLEIGAGKGILTRELLENAGTVISFEKDNALYELVKIRFANEIASGKLLLIHDDIFNIGDYKKILPTPDNPFKIIANIPYNITGKLIPFFFSMNPLPEKIVLLLQKEVAWRITNKDGKGSILSMSVELFSTPKYIKKVPAKLFSPKPRVDSAIILFENISRDNLNLKEFSEDVFFTLLKKGFSKKRKLLKNNLGVKDAILTSCNVKISARAEELSLLNWMCLTKNSTAYDT